MKYFLKTSIVVFLLLGLIPMLHSCSKDDVPTISTLSASEITTNSAKSGGNITSDGGELVILRGIIWSEIQNPTLESHEGISIDGEDIGIFESTLTGLSDNSIYFVKAYAINNVGTAYGNEVSLTTKSINLPVLASSQATNITSTSATSGGTITEDGGGEIYAKGVCWSTAPNPTINNDKTNEGNGSDTFISNLSGLQPGTTYYLRAYAINRAGTVYGDEITFTTKAAIPVLATYPISIISQNQAVSGGYLVSDGGATVLVRGVCWATTTNPTISNDKTTDGNGLGSFSSTLEWLMQGTVYYVRAYATNSEGTSYGNEFKFVTYIHDGESNEYKTVIIGTQIWMAENLRTTRYNNGDPIETTATLYEVIPNESTSKYQWSATPDQPWLSVFGTYYTWYAVMDSRKVCPTGWHIPSNAEWTTLIDYAGGPEIAGDKLEAHCGHNAWRCYPSSGGSTENNETGFTLIGGGLRDDMIDYMAIRRIEEVGFWWSSDEYSITRAYDLSSSWGTPVTGIGSSQKHEGLTVRCIKD